MLNDQNIPPWRLGYNFTDKLGNFSTILRPYYQNSFFKTFFYFVLHSRISRNMSKLRHKLSIAKTGVCPTCTWSNEAWFTLSLCNCTQLMFTINADTCAGIYGGCWAQPATEARDSKQVGKQRPLIKALLHLLQWSDMTLFGIYWFEQFYSHPIVPRELESALASSSSLAARVAALEARMADCNIEFRGIWNVLGIYKI